MLHVVILVDPPEVAVVQHLAQLLALPVLLFPDTLSDLPLPYPAHDYKGLLVIISDDFLKH